MSRFLRVILFFFVCLISAFVNAQVGQILWEDNFDSLDSSIWNIDVGDGCPDLCGWGNEELQYYQGDNVSIEAIPGEPGNYALVLEARRESIASKSFTSGKVTTKQKLGVKYGMIEARVKVPDDLSTGLWPAVWMLGTNEDSETWPRCGEIDIMEMGQNNSFRELQELNTDENNLVGANVIFYSKEACSANNPDCAANISFDKFYNQPYQGDSPITNRYLIYRMYWDQNEVRLTVEDNGLIQNFYTGPFPLGPESSEFQKPFYLLMNLAVGGNFTDAQIDSDVTADLPGKMYIDYIRIKQWNGQGEVYLEDRLMANAGADKEILETDSLNLDASGSYGPITSYKWYVDGNEVASTQKYKTKVAPGTHEVNLLIADSNGNTDSDKIKVTVGTDALGEIIWEDNFDSFNSGFWNVISSEECFGSICNTESSELQSYQQDNVYIEEIAEEPGNNALVIEVNEEDGGDFSFSSGMISTENKIAVKYGVVEVRMKIPDLENGLAPAAWMLGVDYRAAGWPRSGQIDMMRMGHERNIREADNYFGSPNGFVAGDLLWFTGAACDATNTNCAASIFFDKGYTTPYTPSTPLNDRYITYRMYWDENQIRLTAVDNGVENDLYAVPFPISPREAVFKKPYFLLFNMAVGGDFTGLFDMSEVTAPVPTKMYIDYIRVKRWNGKGEVIIGDENLISIAGEDITIDDLNKDGQETVSVNGSYSFGNIQAYEWSENGVILSDNASDSLILTTGIHNLKLRVIDINGNESIDYLKVNIRELLWEEEFDILDENVWTAEVGDGCPDLCGWGNNELEFYQSDNAYIEPMPGNPGNNVLVIEAKEETAGDKSFTSARLKSQGNVAVKYGLVETRLKVPDNLSTGLWPAAWLLGTSIEELGWPRSGEIDMMEMGYRAQSRIDEGFEGITENDMVGGNLIFYSESACGDQNPDCAASIASDKYYSKPYVANTSLTNRFLVYRLYWDPNEIRLTAVDEGIEYDLYTGPFPLGRNAEEFHKPFYFLLNLAVGGNFTDASSVDQVTAPLPAKMLVDYIRVFRWNGYGEVAVGSGPIANAGPDIILLDSDGDGMEEVILDGSRSAHQSGEIVSYSWTIDGEVIASGMTAPILLERSTHQVTLTVTDGEGKSASDSNLITVSSGGLGPRANAGEDQFLNDNDGDDLVDVTLDGSASEAADTEIITYRWFYNDQLIGNEEIANVTFSTGTYKVLLEVTDADSLKAEDEVIITIVDPDNLAPIANAGGDQVINDEDGDDMVTVLLDASGSSDVDGTIIAYDWVLDGYHIPSGINSSIKLSTGAYQLVLKVTDDDGVSAENVFTVTIIDPDNDRPIANAGEDSLIIDNDLNGIETVLLSASESTDSDGVIVSYYWQKGENIIGIGEEVEASLTLGEHIIELKVIDDDGDVSYDSVDIIVNQLPIANAGEDILINDDDGDGQEAISLDGTLSMDPDGSIISYQWRNGEEVIGSSELVDYTFDRGSYEITLEVTDNYGSVGKDLLMVRVVNPNNENPVAAAGEDQVKEDEDTSGSETFQLDASESTDDGSIDHYYWFEGSQLIGEGITTNVTLAVGEHKVTLEVIDNEEARSTDEINLTVTQDFCYYEWCTDDFRAKVTSNNFETSITFIPENSDYGSSTCILFYGVGSEMLAGYDVTPNEPYILTDITNGDNINFYYTYNRGDSEFTTSNCQEVFEVGSCSEDPLFNVTIRVMTESSLPVSNAQVTLESSIALTDALGVVVFDQVESGQSLSLQVEKEGFLSYNSSILVTGDETYSITIQQNALSADNQDFIWAVYPNPTKDIVVIEFGEQLKNGEIEIVNASGKSILKSRITDSVINLSLEPFPVGTYFIWLNSMNKTSVKKLVLID